jgi:L-rhamnonate dehydratase
MKIARIEAHAVDCGFQTQALQTTRVAAPMARFERFRERRASWMWPTRKAFVRIETECGAIGWSCTNGGEVVALMVNAHFGPLLAGEDAADITGAWEQMFCSILPTGNSGMPMMAISAVDIALWDLRARAEGRALVELLGGVRRAGVPVYATTSRPEAHGGRGWQGLKAAAPFGPESGAEGLAENVALMRRFREVAGPGTPIMVDAFMAWDVDYTMRFAEAVQELGLSWIEDPLPPYDLPGMRRLKERLGGDVALALGNFAFNRWECAALLEGGLADILQPDVAWAGGITEALRILAMAEEAGTPVILHNTCEQPWALALAAAAPDAQMVEFVDRGAVSPLYGLMGSPAEIEAGAVRFAGPPAWNRPPEDVAALFEGPGARSGTGGN